MGPALAGLALALSHLAAAHLTFLERLPRSVWLSAAGGISVAYVFVHLLPELAHEQAELEEAAGGAVPFLEQHAYLVALAGLAVFYGVELATRGSLARPSAASSDAVTFWLATGSFAVKNAIIGYLLVHRLDDDALALVLFTVAMALHFVVNDVGLRERHGTRYARVGRFVLAAAPLAGVALGFLVEISDPAIAALLAFLAGGVILNVLKEELPSERESRFSAFAAGAAAYSLLLLAL
ncbi:MAG: hypothetical protein M3M94_03540 [Actinomycetota bacterium]|nr:hypothetical protein [Actinomycetota bacterium]